MKSQKGITLIALVITIIVMLILVAVTITMAINGGLFNYAGEATNKTSEELEKEQVIGNGSAIVNGLNGNAATDINGIVDHYVNGTSL